MLVNNAAVLFGPELELDSRGRELALATSHLCHLQLIRALIPARRAARGARVVTVTSGAPRIGEIRWNDLAFATGYHPVAAYAQSKHANVPFTVEFDRRFAGGGHTSRGTPRGRYRTKSARPGRIHSFREAGPRRRARGHDRRSRDWEEDHRTGAATTVFGAASPLLDGIGGVYLKDNDVAMLDDEERTMTADNIPADANSAMLDRTDARRLWDLSEPLLA